MDVNYYFQLLVSFESHDYEHIGTKLFLLVNIHPTLTKFTIELVNAASFDIFVPSLLRWVNVHPTCTI